MSKVYTLVSSCAECPNRSYYSPGKDECVGVSGRGGPKFIPNDGTIPAWCPLPDGPGTPVAEGAQVVGLFSKGADGEMCFHEGRDDAENIAALLDENVTGGPHTMMLALAAPLPATVAAGGEAKDGADARTHAREVAQIFRTFTKSSHRFHDGRPLHLVAAELLEAFARGDHAAGAGIESAEAAVTGTQPRASEEACRAVLADVDPVVIYAWKLQGWTVGAMLRDAQASVIELQEKLGDVADAAPAAPVHSADEVMKQVHLLVKAADEDKPTGFYEQVVREMLGRGVVPDAKESADA